MPDHPASLDLVEQTALLQACWRAQAARRDPTRLQDPLACEIADVHADPAFAARLLSGPAAAAYAELHMACTLAADGRLERWAHAAPGPKQVVILGCGFDGRARRSDLGSGTTFFLVDRPRVLQLLSRYLPAEPSRCALVEANLGNADALFDALAAAKFRRDIRAAFVAEGVAEFLGVRRTRDLIGACRRSSAQGSLLLLQLLDPNLVSFAAHAGDTTFPWRKLPPPAEILDGERAADIFPVHAASPWNVSFFAPLAHVVAIQL
jgi:methyltransferase (TIGR00027 family)